MADFSSGVKAFIHGKATVTVNFPVDFRGNADVSCRQCPYLSSNSRMCQLNKQPVQYPEKYVGYDCPLRITEMEENENEEI